MIPVGYRESLTGGVTTDSRSPDAAMGQCEAPPDGAIRGPHSRSLPDFAALHPGYGPALETAICKCSEDGSVPGWLSGNTSRDAALTKGFPSRG